MKYFLEQSLKSNFHYPSNKCDLVEFMALSTVAIASLIDAVTKGSPVRLTSGTIKGGYNTMIS